MVINWATAVAGIAADDSATAAAIRSKVNTLGALYDLAGHPDVMIESAAHVLWRADMTSQLAARDKAAASIDLQPLTTIDPSNPAASRPVINQRLGAIVTSGAVGALIADMRASKLPAEPAQWIAAYYARTTLHSTFSSVGDIEAALVAALAELTAYIGFQ